MGTFLLPSNVLQNLFARYYANVVWDQPALFYHLFPKLLCMPPFPNCMPPTKQATGPSPVLIQGKPLNWNCPVDGLEKRHTARTASLSSSVTLLDLSASPGFVVSLLGSLGCLNAKPQGPECNPYQWQRTLGKEGFSWVSLFSKSCYLLLSLQHILYPFSFVYYIAHDIFLYDSIVWLREFE